ncbi:MAG: hypothetical protein MZV63_29555 [Marinilabiliales bacterium]|nr:hypothetical protein [Marinilabiliales bacterium]
MIIVLLINPFLLSAQSFVGNSALKKKYDKKEVYITMRDGVRLFTSVYTPKNSSVEHPILMNRTPYNIEPGGPDNFNYFVQGYSRYIDEEYIMVFQDVQGKYMSEGVYEDIRPVIPVKKNKKETDETTDTWDTVEWLIKNVANNNGNVGIFRNLLSRILFHNGNNQCTSGS